MSTERRKRLFFVLAVVLTVSVMAAVTGRGIERLRTAEEKSGQYRTQIARLRQSLQMQSQSASRRQQLEDQMKIARARFYPPGEIDPYSFGTMVRKRLAAEGMRVIRYQVVEIKGRSGLEFTGPNSAGLGSAGRERIAGLSGGKLGARGGGAITYAGWAELAPGLRG